jgi:hypothetical protein
MNREGVTVLGRPLVHVDDLHTESVPLQEQGRDEADRTGADDEDLRIGMTKHRAASSRAPRKNCDPEVDQSSGHRQADAATSELGRPLKNVGLNGTWKMVNGKRSSRAFVFRPETGPVDTL